MDIYLFGFIILAFGSLVVTVLVMYSHSHKLQSTVGDLEKELDSMYQCHASETNPWELADTLHKKFTNKIEAQQHLVDTLTSKLELAQTARELQQKQIKELQEELEEIQKEFFSYQASADKYYSTGQHQNG